MLGMTVDEMIAYNWALKIGRLAKKVAEVEPLYLDDNMPDVGELVYKVAGLNPFRGLKEL